MSRCRDAHAWRRNDAQFRAGLERAFRFYGSLGAAEIDLAGLSESLPQPAHVLARVAWRVRRTDGSELVTLEVSYMMRVRHADPSIVALVDHDEEGRLIDRDLSAPTDCLLFTLPDEQRPERQRSPISGKVDTYELFAPLERRRAAR